MICKRLTNLTLFIAFSFFLSPPPATAQANASDDAVEVYLSFRHRGVINSMVTAYYHNNNFYLPVGELFSLFNIDYHVTGLVAEGRFSTGRTPYHIDFKSNTISFGGKTYHLKQEDFLIRELDNYLHPDLFEEIFGLSFTIDFNNLTLDLETNAELPAVANAIRRQRRTIAEQNRFSQERYPLRYGRERPFFDGGFLDYNVSGSYSPGSAIFNFNTNLGLQVYGGDFQGVVFGNYSGNTPYFATSNMRWRYRYVDNPIISTLVAGQTATDGLNRNNYTGIRISNDPIEPRRLFDEFEIQGTTIPEAEVELYLNNALIDFQQADALGNYRFLAPISYGTSQMDLNIYGPTGQVIERSQRIQVPFNFQPQGVFNYQFNFGRLNTPVFGSTKRGLTAQLNGAYGLTSWLTAKAGVEYYQNYHNTIPTFTTTLSSRILSHYLFTLEAATEAYYRTALNVIYPNSASFNVDFTKFNSTLGIYNASNDDEHLNISTFLPFAIFDMPFNIRATAYSRFRNGINTTTFRFNTGLRLGKLNLRFGYSDRLVDSYNILEASSNSYLESSATYNFSRNRSLPAYLRGVYLRAQMRYMPTASQFESAQITASQNIFQTGRIQLTYERNFNAGFNLLRFSLVVDFGAVRSSTTGNINRGIFSSTQNFRGSIGYDTGFENFIFTSRDQVGRAGAALKLFVDNNANSIFDEGDQSINDNAIRLQRSGATSLIKNDVLYFTQMQPYFFYNMEVNKGSIKNPMLVPDFEKFGIITDPNRFKQIEIPFYMSGVIEGAVERRFSEGRVSGIGGLKLILENLDRTFRQEIRTFSDGSYYAYEIPPGEYEIRIDSSQLEILKSISNPDSIRFELQAISEGDFVDGLNFLLTPVKTEPDTIAVPELEPLPDIELEELEVVTLEEGLCTYILQLGSFSSEENAKAAISLIPQESNPFIVYNEETNLYAVRVTAYPSLGQASEMVERLYANNYNDVAVLHNCTENPEGSRFDLQLAAFRNEAQADNYIAEFEQNYELNPVKFRDNEGSIFVILSSFTDLEAAQHRKSEILNEHPDLKIDVAKRSFTSTISANYHYLLQLGIFETEYEAEVYAARLKKEINFSSNIVVDERGTVILFIENPFTRWSNITRVRRDISRLPDFNDPIIHLSEIN